MASNAKDAGKGFLLQGDLNATLGPNIIKGDPNPQTGNGKLFECFLKTYNITVVNSLSLCKGSITRQRRFVNKPSEQSIIDFYAVCPRVLNYVKQMEIYNDRHYIVTNYTQVKKGGKAIDTDHNTLLLELNLQTCPVINKKREIFV